MTETRSTAPSGRILLVEDDPDAAMFFRDVLTGRGGYEVTHTADPALALTWPLARRGACCSPTFTCRA